MGDRRPDRGRPSPGDRRSVSPDAWGHRARPRGGHARGSRGTGALAVRRAVHPAVAALAARSPMVEPPDTDLPGRTPFAERGPDSPFGGAPHVALLRNTRGPRRQPPAARQSPGRPRAGRGPSYLSHQHRALSALDGRRAGLRLARDARDRRAARIDTGQHGPPRAVSGPLLQLVRDARPPAARAAVRLDGRQRKPRRSPHRARQRVPGDDGAAARQRRGAARNRRRVAPLPGSSEPAHRRPPQPDRHPDQSRRGDRCPGNVARGTRGQPGGMGRAPAPPRHTGRHARRRREDVRRRTRRRRRRRRPRLDPGHARRHSEPPAGRRRERALIGRRPRARAPPLRHPSPLPRDVRGDGVRVPVRPDAQDLLDRVSGARRQPRSRGLRSARIRSPAGELHRDRQGRGPGVTLVPARAADDTRRAGRGPRLLVGVDVRVPHAGADHGFATGEPARPDRTLGGPPPEGVRRRTRRPLGNLRIRLQRARSRIHLPVLELRRARPRPRERTERGPRDRSLRDRAGGDDRPRGGGPQLRRTRGGGRAGVARVLRGARLHADSAPGRDRGGRGARLHGPSSGDDAGRAHQCPPERCDARALPRRTHRPGDRAAAAGAGAPQRGGHPPAGRRGQGAGAGARFRRADLPPVQIAPRLDSADAPALQRTLRGDADGRGVGLQPVRRTRRHPLARGRHARSLGHVRLPAGYPERSSLVGDLPADRGRGGLLRGHVLRGPSGVSPARRHDHDHARRRGLPRRRRRDSPRHAHEPRGTGARDRADLLLRARAGAGSGRCSTPGVLESLRSDGVRARARRLARHPAAARCRRSASLGGARRHRRGPTRQRGAARDRARAIPRSRPWNPHPDVGHRRPAALQYDRLGARPDLQPQAAGPPRAGRQRPGRLLHARRSFTRAGARARREVSRPGHV